MFSVNRLLFLAACTVAIPLSMVKAATVTISGTSQVDDAFVYQFLPTTNFDFIPTFNPYLPAGNIDSTGHTTQSFVKFDLSSLSAYSATDITSATLRLRVVPTTESGFGANPTETYPVTADFYVVTSTWTETGVTWNTKPTTGSLISSVSGIDESGYWLELTITGLVQGWKDSSITNYGIAISQPSEVRNGSNEATFATFASTQYTNPAFGPQLVVEAVPEPSTCLLLGVAGLAGVLFRRRR